MAEWIRIVRYDGSKVEVEWDCGVKTTIGYGIGRVVINTEHGYLYLRNGVLGVWKFATIRYEVAVNNELWIYIDIR